MPRRRRFDRIDPTHLQQIERQASLLAGTLREAQVLLRPFCRHYEAASELATHLQRAINLLNDRPVEYKAPHGSHSAGIRSS